jgi:hypothetical protein
MGSKLNITTKARFLKMQSRIRYLIYSQAYDGWLNRLADGHTQNIFAAIWFSSAEHAESWLNTYDRAPKDIENYEIQRTKTVMEVEEDEHLSKID